jgi:hypothetical protein
MQENQQVVFLSDGGDSVRNLQAYLHPDSEHWLDWFHITMRISLLQQQVKTLKDEQPEELEAVLRPAGRRRQHSPPRACRWCEADHQLLLPE